MGAASSTLAHGNRGAQCTGVGCGDAQCGGRGARGGRCPDANRGMQEVGQLAAQHSRQRGYPADRGERRPPARRASGKRERDPQCGGVCGERTGTLR